MLNGSRTQALSYLGGSYSYIVGKSHLVAAQSVAVAESYSLAALPAHSVEAVVGAIVLDLQIFKNIEILFTTVKCLDPILSRYFQLNFIVL